MNIKRKGLYLIGTVFVTIGLLAGCGSGEGVAPKKDKQVVTKEQFLQDKEEVENDNVINVSAFEMGYTLPEITLEKGKEYTLVMKNDGKIFHDLTTKDLDVEITYMSEMPDHPEGMSFIDKIFGVKTVYASGNHDGEHDDSHGEIMKYIHMNAKSGQTVKIKFIPKETGGFKFYCSVPGHEEAGMHGEFEVK